MSLGFKRLKMEPIGLTETSVTIYISTQRNIPEDLIYSAAEA